MVDAFNSPSDLTFCLIGPGYIGKMAIILVTQNGFGIDTVLVRGRTSKLWMMVFYDYYMVILLLLLL